MATKQVAPPVRDWLTAEQGRICAVREAARAARIARDTVHCLTLASAYAAVYEAEKAAIGGLDFADLIVKTKELLTTREDAAWVLYKLDGGIDHILLDEAQDTAPEQWEIVARAHRRPVRRRQRARRGGARDAAPCSSSATRSSRSSPSRAPRPERFWTRRASATSPRSGRRAARPKPCRCTPPIARRPRS